MQSLKFPLIRIGGAVVAIGTLVCVLVLGVGSAAAASLSYSLVLASGATSSGGGSVMLTSTGSAVQMQIDLSGARAGNSYSLSVCTNNGTSYGCTAAGTIITDASGSFHGTALLALPAQIDLITLVNSADQLDAYQAVTGTTPLYSNTSLATRAYSFPYGTTVAYGTGYSYPYGLGASITLPAGAQVMADGTIMLPASSTTTASACPVGYHGPLLLSTSGSVGTSYQYSALYGLIAVPSATVPSGAGTMLIYC